LKFRDIKKKIKKKQSRVVRRETHQNLEVAKQKKKTFLSSWMHLRKPKIQKEPKP
jgi:hypothetical protein